MVAVMVITERHLNRWSVGLLAVTAILAILSVVMFWTLRGGRYNDVLMYFHLGSELGAAAYWNAALLALVSAAAVLSAILSIDVAARWGWLVVGAVALFLSIDEATRLHERTAVLVTHNPFPTFAWLVVGIPSAAGLVVVLWLATRSLPSSLKRGLGTALAIYLVGALGFEALSGYFWRQERPRVSDLFGTIEEVFEMGACILAIHLIARTWLPLRLTPRYRLAGPQPKAGSSSDRSEAVQPAARIAP